MAKKIPEHIAFQLAQKTKEQAKKLKEAEKKVKEAEKKVKDADKKAKEADKKAKEAEEAEGEGEEDDSEIDLDILDELDDLDDFDDFDDFDDVEEEDAEEEDAEEEDVEEVVEEVGEEVSEAEDEISQSEESGDDQLEALLKQAKGPVFESKVERANRLAEEGDFNEALEIWKELTASDGNDPANWRGLASVLESRNDSGDADKAKTAKDHADRLETQAVADATGRKMEDIIADLLDDGILNFSAGSDAKEQTITEESDDDDLTKLPGIGSVGQQKLNFAGIDTFEQLSEKSDEEIAEILDAKKVESWSGMARMLAKEKK
ncbi:MAG: hypothetical protein CMA12_05940 [Euryarchaeota archaeon]|nr:hypothetical protein [Euryarchaeota archaeon]